MRMHEPGAADVKIPAAIADDTADAEELTEPVAAQQLAVQSKDTHLVALFWQSAGLRGRVGGDSSKTQI